MKFELRAYIAINGKSYFREWVESLDLRTTKTIDRRLLRLETGNFGDVKPIGEGLSELRIDYGPGYRVYFGRAGKEIILLLCGSDKSGQDRAIAKAKSLWKEYKETK
jgi:putative addiction module killer protein